MSDIIGPQRCFLCGGEYGQHVRGCEMGSETLALRVSDAKIIVRQVEILSKVFKFYMPSGVTKLKGQLEALGIFTEGGITAD